MKLYNLLYKMMGVKIGRSVKLQGLPIIVNKGKISIGNRSVVKSSFLSNLLGLYQRSIIVTRNKDAVIEIGENVGISGVTIYARKEIKIGSHTRIGANTKLMDNDFHPVDPQLRLECSQDIATKPIIIGENVFIGCNSLVLKGVEIGDNTTIGAGSVVTKNIPANCIAAGNPAKVIKFLDGEQP